MLFWPIKYNIMRNSNNNNNRQEQLKAIAKSTYSITDRTQSKLYLNKMHTVRKVSARSRLPLHEQSTVVASKVSQNAGQLKQHFDSFVKELFKQLDFDCAGFVSSSKIAHNKDMPENVFYFFGGVLQKVRQVGAVTQKVFLSLCDDLFLHAKATDIEEMLAGEGCIKVKIGRKGKQGKKDKHTVSCSTLKHAKSLQKLDASTKHDQPPFKDKLANSTLSKKQSLKLHLQCMQRGNRSASQPQRRDLSQLEALQTKRGDKLSNFDSLRVRQLSERLDRQIIQSQARISLNKYLR